MRRALPLWADFIGLLSINCREFVISHVLIYIYTLFMRPYMVDRLVYTCGETYIQYEYMAHTQLQSQVHYLRTTGVHFHIRIQIV